ncbi:MAG: FecR family protein [Verrucomicrobiota bacterium]|nr:FecR family protein [Verrucomicrobiota bacterium]
MRRAPIVVLLSAVALLSTPLTAQESAQTATLISKDNRVDVARAGGGWSVASVGQKLNVGDQLRTGEDSRATVRMSDGSVLQLDELTTIEIKSPTAAESNATLNMPKGSAFFFSRGKSREVRIETPAANGAIRGTAFVLKVTSAATAVSMIEGAFGLSNSGGAVTAREGQSANAGMGGAPAQNTLSDFGDAAPWYLVLENHLAHPRPLRNADRRQFFSALPDATKRFRMIAPQLAGASTIARTDWALDILRESFKAVGPDCGMRARILRSVTQADPKDADKLLELAIALGPDCAGSFGGGGGGGIPGDEGGPPGMNNGNLIPPGSNGGGGGQGNLVAVCHNGQTIFLTSDAVQAFLKQNPGAKLGACQLTPIGNP